MARTLAQRRHRPRLPCRPIASPSDPAQRRPDQSAERPERRRDQGRRHSPCRLPESGAADSRGPLRRHRTKAHGDAAGDRSHPHAARPPLRFARRRAESQVRRGRAGTPAPAQQGERTATRRCRCRLQGALAAIHRPAGAADRRYAQADAGSKARFRRAKTAADEASATVAAACPNTAPQNVTERFDAIDARLKATIAAIKTGRAEVEGVLCDAHRRAEGAIQSSVAAGNSAPDATSRG